MKISNRVKLLKKLFAVMSAIPELAKTGQMKEGESTSYAYHEADAIRDAFRKELLANRLLCLPAEIRHERWANTTSSGGTFNYCLANVTFRFVDVDTGFSLDVSSVGVGGDSLDKTAPKALIQALKYMFTNGFFVKGIELDGDSPDEQLAGREANREHQWFEGVPESIHCAKELSSVLMDGVRLFAAHKKMYAQLKKFEKMETLPRMKLRTYMGTLNGNGVNPHPLIDKIEVIDVPAQAKTTESETAGAPENSRESGETYS